MKIALNTVPWVGPNDRKLDQNSWTYRALRAQDEIASKPGCPPNLFESLILPKLVRSIFLYPQVKPNSKTGPGEYEEACRILSEWVPTHTLGWSELTDRFTEVDYPRIRRMLERTDYYEALFNCKPGGLTGAWNRFFVVSGGGTAEDAKQNSDIKALFMLHLSIGPMTQEAARMNLERPRRGRPYKGPRFPVRYSESVETLEVAALPKPAADFFRGLQELYPPGQEAALEQDLSWALERLQNRVLERSAAEQETVEPEEIRIVEPAFVVDFESSDKRTK